jgi:hypothetical protein
LCCANGSESGRYGVYRCAFGQGYKDMSPASKELMKLTMEKKLVHGGNPVLRWMMDNALKFNVFVISSKW